MFSVFRLTHLQFNLVPLALLAALGLAIGFTSIGGAQQPTLAPGSVVHRVYSTVETPAADPADPYHLPIDAVTPARRTTKQWSLVGVSGREQATYIVVKDSTGKTVQVAQRDGTTERTWWPALGQMWVEPIAQSIPILDIDPASLSTSANGYVRVGQTTVAGHSATIHERRVAPANGPAYTERLIVGTDPLGVALGERIEPIGTQGSALARSVETTLWEIIPATQAPSELRNWTPPQAARVVEPSAKRSLTARSIVETQTQLEHTAPFRVFRAGPEVRLTSVYHGTIQTVPDDGSVTGAILHGDAANSIFSTPTPGQAVDLTVGRRDTVVARFQRTPAAWQRALAIAANVAGQPTTVWFTEDASISPPAGSAAVEAPSANTAAFADLGDVFVIARFQGFTQLQALDFLRALTSVPRAFLADHLTLHE